MSHSYNYSSTNQLPVFTNIFFLSTIRWICRQGKCSSQPTTSLRTPRDIHARNQEFLQFLACCNQSELKAKYTLQAIRDVRITKRKKTRKCSSIGKHSKALMAHNWKIIMHYKSRQHKCEQKKRRWTETSQQPRQYFAWWKSKNN